jgi:hypothetical protein
MTNWSLQSKLSALLWGFSLLVFATIVGAWVLHGFDWCPRRPQSGANLTT